MTITERTLKRWRKGSLEEQKLLSELTHVTTPMPVATLKETHERILRLTQELLDQHLLRSAKKL